MRKNTIIEHEQFKKILQYEDAVKGSAARNHLKMELLNSVISAIGEKWIRMKKETRSALEYLCFLSIERGFVYAGSEHVSKRYNIDSSTVRRYLSYLEKEGCIKRLWRSSSKHNGRGKAVIFFIEHPYFKKYWNEMFFSFNNAQPNTQAENSRNSSNNNENDREKVSTINKPNISNNLLNKRYNDIELDASFTNTRVPKEFVEYVKQFYDSAKIIEELWKCVYLQTKQLIYYTNSDRLNLGIRAFKQLVRSIKYKKKIKSLYGYFWGILDNLLDEEYEQIWLESFENAG